MRYQDWDILIFPWDTNVPFKEFKVDCNVVHDMEFGHGTDSYGIPTVTCFIPSLAAGAPFTISVHSWRTPELSQITRAYSKHPEAIKFEARVFIDGYLVASAAFDPCGKWPNIIADTNGFTKQGDREPLGFPSFRNELLHENYWNPADNHGRVKIIISEGFPRDSPTHPIERVKNVVAFAFQHAPLEILEACSIAWPSSAMWSRAPLAAAMHVPTYHPEDGSSSHHHSPRRRASHSAGMVDLGTAPPSIDDTHPCRFGPDSATRSSGMVLRESSGNMSMDMSMPDYTSSSQSSRVPTTSHNSAYRETSFGTQAQRPSPKERSRGLSIKGLANMPTAAKLGGASISGSTACAINHWDSDREDIASALAKSLLHNSTPHTAAAQKPHLPAVEIKSRKENRLMYGDRRPRASSSGDSGHPPAERPHTRKVSQPLLGQAYPISPVRGTPIQRRDGDSQSSIEASLTNMARQEPEAGPRDGRGRRVQMFGGSDQGGKRMRYFTLASARAIDEEDEPQRRGSRVRIGSMVSNSTVN